MPDDALLSPQFCRYHPNLCRYHPNFCRPILIATRRGPPRPPPRYAPLSLTGCVQLVLSDILTVFCLIWGV